MKFNKMRMYREGGPTKKSIRETLTEPEVTPEDTVVKVRKKTSKKKTGYIKLDKRVSKK